MDLSQEQEAIANAIINELDSSKVMRNPYDLDYRQRILKVGGLAGTGKTFLITQLSLFLKSKYKNFAIAFVAFTGKASSVLNKKLEEENALSQWDRVSTIHSLIYEPLLSYDATLNKHVITGWRKRRNLEVDMFNLIIIDEASMLSNELFNDLQSFGVSIIAVGDHCQLPPVGDTSFLMQNPDYFLTKVHRNALNSPLISISHHLRRGGYLSPGKSYGDGVFKLSWDDQNCRDLFENTVSNYSNDLIVLCATNRKRVSLNQNIRRLLNFSEPEPYPSERVVCLKNNHDSKVMNGQTGTIIWTMPGETDTIKLTIDMDDFPEPYESLSHMMCFGQEKYEFHNLFTDRKKYFQILSKKANKLGYSGIDFFDFGYAISVHKAQGSEWDRVILCEERCYYWDDEFYRRWLYTAATRAKEKLFIIQDY